MQGYNAQAAVTDAQIVIAAEVTIDSPDVGHLGPMVAATATELAAIGSTEAPQVVAADAGYWHQVQMDRIIERGIQVLIPPDAGKRRGVRPGWDGGLYAFMGYSQDTPKKYIRRVPARFEPTFDVYRGRIAPRWNHTEPPQRPSAALLHLSALSWLYPMSPLRLAP